MTPLTPARRRDDAWLAAQVHVQPEAFDVLFQRHWTKLRAYCLGMLGRADEAQDVAQEAMVRTYERLRRVEDAPPFRPLLFAIARNACIDRLRLQRRDGGPVEEHHLPAVSGADELATGRGRLGLLVSDLHALSEHQRTALVLREACGHSHDEIAASLQTTSARVKSLISEARQALGERRRGRDLSCEEYRRGLARLRGPLRNQRLLAHRSTCVRCGDRPLPLHVLGLPALGLGWLWRLAHLGATPAATKIAVVAGCVGAAAVPLAASGPPAERPPHTTPLRTSPVASPVALRVIRRPVAPHEHPGARTRVRPRFAHARVPVRRVTATAEAHGATASRPPAAPAAAPTGAAPQTSPAVEPVTAVAREVGRRVAPALDAVATVVGQVTDEVVATNPTLAPFLRR